MSLFFHSATSKVDEGFSLTRQCFLSTVRTHWSETTANWLQPLIDKHFPIFLFDRSRSNNRCLTIRNSYTWIKIQLVLAEQVKFHQWQALDISMSDLDVLLPIWLYDLSWDLNISREKEMGLYESSRRSSLSPLCITTTADSYMKGGSKPEVNASLIICSKVTRSISPYCFKSR